MHENIAKEVIQTLLLIGENTDKLVFLSEEIENEVEKVNFRKNIAKIINATAIDIMDPIIKEYPHLDPFKELFAEWDRLEGKIKD